MNRLHRIIIILLCIVGLAWAYEIQNTVSSGSRFSMTLATSGFRTEQWSEDGQIYTRYRVDAADNTIKIDDRTSYDVLQFPIAVYRQIPTVQVSILKTEEMDHPVEASQLYSISDVHTFRGQKMVYLTINPFLPGGKVASELAIRIDLKDDPGNRRANDHTNALFLNADYADRISGTKVTSKPAMLKKMTNFSGTWVDLRIDEEGIYSLKRSDLIDLGVSGSFDDENIFLFAGPGFGAPLRSYFPDSSDFHLKQVPMLFIEGATESDDQWIFYASPTSAWKRGTPVTNIRNVTFLRNSYEDNQHFKLLVGTSNQTPLRMALNAPAFTGTETEQDYVYRRFHHEEELINPAKGGELWLGRRLTSNSTFPFYLNNLYVNESVSGALRYSLGATTENFYNYDIYVNGTLLYDSPNVKPSDNAEDAEYETQFMRKDTRSLSNNLLSENSTVKIAFHGSTSTTEGFLDYLDMIYPARPEAIDGQLDMWFLPDPVDRKVHLSDLNASVSYVFSVEDPFATDYFPVSGSSTDILIPSSDANTSFWVVNESHFMSPDSLKLQADFVPTVTDDHAAQVDFIIITPDMFLPEANRLASFKEARSIQPLTTMVKTYSEIVDQYNAGNRDPYAIQHFLADMSRKCPDPKPMYVLLFGDGHYDYQNRIFTQKEDYIPFLYEPNYLWPCDDIYVMVDSIDDATNDMAIGRIPANSISEIRAVVNKIIEYDEREYPGEWQLNAMLVADDPTDLEQNRAGQVIFINDSETMNNSYLPKVMQTKKIYLTEYPERYITELQTTGRDGAREDIMETFLNGVSLVNYYGHGDPSVWAQEKVFVTNDLVRLEVNHHYPFILAGTCSWGRSDNPDFQSMAEEMVTMESNGAIGSYATVRGVYHDYNVAFIEDFLTALFEGNPDFAYSPLMGDAALYAKNRSNGSTGNRMTYNMKFMFFGDPTLVPAFPRYAGAIDSVSRDTLRALDHVTITGRALDREGEGLNESGLKGRITVYDNQYKVSRDYITSSGATSYISYYLEGNRLFNGDFTFDGNDFTTEVFIPKDIQYAGTTGKIRMIYWNEDGMIDGTAGFSGIHVGGINPDAAADVSGPEVQINFGDDELQNGAVVFDTASLVIRFEDQSGINITGSTGHVLEMSIDNGQQVVDLGELFTYDANNYMSGQVTFPVSNYLDEGEHQIEIQAFDNYNNYSQYELTLTVLQTGDDLIQYMVNFPNPFRDRTNITFSSAVNGMADLRVYSLSGKPVSHQEDIPVYQGFNAIPVAAEDNYGHPLAAGVYYYVVEIETTSGTIKQHNKMVVLP